MRSNFRFQAARTSNLLGPERVQLGVRARAAEPQCVGRDAALDSRLSFRPAAPPVTEIGNLGGSESMDTSADPYPKYLDWLRYLSAFLLLLYGSSKLLGRQFSVPPGLALRPLDP